MKLTRRQSARLLLVRIALDDTAVRDIVDPDGEAWKRIVEADPHALADMRGQGAPQWLEAFRNGVDKLIQKVPI